MGEVFDEKIELDKNAGHRKGKQGRGVAGEGVVFGILKRQGKVFTVVVNDTKSKTLQPVITGKIKPDSWVYSDTYRGYDTLGINEFHHE